MTERALVSIIKAVVCEEFSVTEAAIMSHGRSRHLVWPRHVAILLCAEMAGLTTAAIGRHFASRDHTTIVHAIKTVRFRLAADASYRALYDRCRARLGDPARVAAAAEAADSATAVLASLRTLVRQAALKDPARMAAGLTALARTIVHGETT